MRYKKVKKDSILIFLIIIIESLLIKFFQFSKLPAKYFYDSNKIIAIMNGSSLTDKAFSFTANLFNSINIFGISDIQDWSYLITLIGLMSLMPYFLRTKMNIRMSMFAVASMALVNIFVFNLSKDVIQFAFFMISFHICTKKNFSLKSKVLLITLIFLIESYLFRTYYLIMALLVVTIYYSFLFIKKRTENGISPTKSILVILGSFTIFMFIIFSLQRISPSSYLTILSVRSRSNAFRESTDAVTMINDIFVNSSFQKFLANYFLNTLRILFPIELVFKGIKYLPFIIYQLWFSIILIRTALQKMNEKLIYIIVIISFVMVSVLFEPDFGSVVRHEAVLVLFMMALIEDER